MTLSELLRERLNLNTAEAKAKRLDSSTVVMGHTGRDGAQITAGVPSAGAGPRGAGRRGACLNTE